MKNTILLSLTTLALVACDGPWNTYPADYTPPDPTLRVSLFIVGGRTFDTLWLERTQPLSLAYDSTRAFVQSATIEVLSADDGSKVVGYVKVPGSAVAWVPDGQVVALAGRRYRLQAHVVWNSDKNWPGGTTIATTDLSADATVPDSWSIDPTAQVSLENLIPSLSAGADVNDTLILPPGALARYSMTAGTLDSLRQGLPTYRPFHRGDTLWYISDDAHKIVNPDGKTVSRAYRQILFAQLPGPDFGGVFAVERFDPSRARILDPVTKAFQQTLGRTGFRQEDSARYYQPGQTRYAFGPYAAYAPDIHGWPNTYPFSNLTLGYTGSNTIYFYSVEAQYVIYQSQLSKQAQGDRTALPYSNVKGGTGYFTAALVDSFSLVVGATGVDTFSVQALRGAACRRSWKTSQSDGTPFDSLVACQGVDFRK